MRARLIKDDLVQPKDPRVRLVLRMIKVRTTAHSN